MAAPIPRIASVAALAPGILEIIWRDGDRARVDLRGWFEGGEDALTSLADPQVFAAASVGEHGAFVTWDGGEGDLAIDAAHLQRLAAEQSASAGIAA